MAKLLKSTRSSLLDVMRGVAVVTMILYHALYDLHRWGGAVELGIGGIPKSFWSVMPLLIGGSFFFLSGVSSCKLGKRIDSSREGIWRHRFATRAARIGLAALVVTIVSSLVDPHWPIYFGVLHCLAVSSLLIKPVIASGRLPITLIVSIASFVIGALADGFYIPWDPLFVLGFQTSITKQGDYFPLFPWFGVVCAGVAWVQFMETARGQMIAKKLIRKFAWQPPQFVLQKLEFMGKHSLLIYLVHQPILIGLLWAVGLAQTLFKGA